MIDTPASGPVSDDAPSTDDDLDDPWLQSLAAAPPIALGEPRLPPDTIVAQSYRIHRELGAGGMSVVYEATDQVLSRRIALKVHEIGSSDRAARIWREARAMARLAHPNVVTVHEVGVEGSRGYIAMELVEGTNARAWVEQQPRRWDEIVAVYRQAGQGLAAAHDAGIVHRDFKPDNVLVGGDGRVRVADFGLALDPGVLSLPTISDTPRLESLTLTGATAGTPEYMAPEQARGEPADARSDQYAFCVALFEALHGHRPAVAPEPVAEHAEATMPPWIAAVLERGLNVDPNQRHTDMHMLVAALDPEPRGRRHARRLPFAGTLIAGAMLLGAGRWLAQAQERGPICAGADAAMDAAWSAERLGALQAAFAERPPSLRDATLAVLEPGFDSWANAWREAAREACEATHVRGQQSVERLDLRNDCLDRARTRFAAAISVFDDGDAMSMAAAETVVARLPDVTMCARADAAIATDPVRPERVEVHAQLRAMLDRAAAQVAASRLEQARAILDALIPSLELEGFVTSLAEARRLRGEVALDMGRQPEAVAELGAAAALTFGGSDRDAIARTQLSLARAVGRRGAGHDEGQRLLAGVRTLAEGLGWSRSRQLAVRVAELELAFFAERYDETLRLGQLLLDDPDVEDHARVRVMTLLATTLERQSRFIDALAAHDRALAFVEGVRAPDHPQVASVLGNRANVLMRLTRDDEARRSLQRALAIRIASFGPEAPTVGEIYRQLGDITRTADEAIVEYERALTIHRAAGDEVGQFFDLSNLAGRVEEKGLLTRARNLYDEALGVAQRAFGPDSLHVARLLINRSSTLYKAAELARGAADLEQAIATMVSHLPEGDIGVATARLSLARFYAALGRPDEAVALFEAGERALFAAHSADHQRRMAIMFEHARLLDQVGRPQAALQQWQATIAFLESNVGADDPLRIEVYTAWSARLRQDGRTAEARKVLARAQALDARLDDDPARTAEIAALVAAARR